MPEIGKRSSDWRHMDATFVSAIEALCAARIFVKNRFDDGSAEGAFRLLTPPEAPGHTVNIAESIWLQDRRGYRPDLERMMIAEMQLDRASTALKEFTTAVDSQGQEAKELSSNSNILAVLTDRARTKSDMLFSWWSGIRRRFIANVHPIPSANDNLLLVRDFLNSLIKKFKQLLRPGVECFAGQDQLDILVRRTGSKILHIVRRLCAVPFLRYSPMSALRFLRGWNRFWRDIIVAPGFAQAGIKTTRNGKDSNLRPSASATMLLASIAGFYGLMLSSTAAEIAAPQNVSVAMIAADPIVTGALARRTTAARVARCSMRAWGKACYPRRSRP